MFVHPGAIFKEWFNTKDSRPNMLIQLLCRGYWNDYNIKTTIQKYMQVINIKLQCYNIKRIKSEQFQV